MAEIILGTHLNFSGNQALNMALQTLAVAPSTTGLPIGYVYWNTAQNTSYVWSGSEWVDLGQVYTHPTFAGTSYPTTAATGASVPSRIIVNNGHVEDVEWRTITAANIGAAPTSHTHTFAQITGLGANTILGNNTTATGVAKALTVGELLTMMSIAYGDATVLTTGTDTTQRTWTAKQLMDFVNSKISTYLTVVNLGYTASATNGTITNSAGSNAVIPAATTTNAGLMLPAEKTKLTGIAAGANNYVHPTVNPGTHPFSTELTAGLLILSQLVVNGEGHLVTVKGRNITAADIAAILFANTSNTATTQTWSASKIYTEIQAAINQSQTGALQYKGDYNPTTNTPAITTDNTVKVGYTYVVTASGTFAGQAVEAGDMIIAKVNNPGSTAANWQIVNKNIPAVEDATTTVKGWIQLATNTEAIAGTDNTKAITPATLKAVLDASIGGHTALFGDGSSTSFTIPHPLNTKFLIMTVYREADGVPVWMDVRPASNSTVTINCNTAIATNSHRIVIKK